MIGLPHVVSPTNTKYKNRSKDQYRGYCDRQGGTRLLVIYIQFDNYF